jgi:hypothetical protein
VTSTQVECWSLYKGGPTLGGIDPYKIPKTRVQHVVLSDVFISRKVKKLVLKSSFMFYPF